jgi:hypothetical protein
MIICAYSINYCRDSKKQNKEEQIDELKEQIDELKEQIL